MEQYTKSHSRKMNKNASVCSFQPFMILMQSAKEKSVLSFSNSPRPQSQSKISRYEGSVTMSHWRFHARFVRLGCDILYRLYVCPQYGQGPLQHEVYQVYF